MSTPSTSQCIANNVYLGYKDPKSGSRLYNSDECTQLNGTWISDNNTCKKYTQTSSTSLSSLCRNVPINTNICSISDITSVNTLDSNNRNIKLYTKSSCQTLNGTWTKTNTAESNLPNNTLSLEVGTCTSSPSVSTNFSEVCAYHPSSYIIPQETNNLIKATYNIPNVNNNCPNNYQWKIDESTNKLICANVDETGELTDKSLPVANYNMNFKISNIKVSENCPTGYTLISSGNDMKCKSGLTKIATTKNLHVSDICPPTYTISNNGNTVICTKGDSILPTANYAPSWTPVDILYSVSTPSNTPSNTPF